MLNIVIIDGKTLNPGDLSWAPFNELGHVTVYDESAKDNTIARIQDADIVVTNKVVFDKSAIEQLPRLKCICVTATGYNIIDVDEASKRNIAVYNASGYSTPSTAQHTIALILELTNSCGDYSQSVSRGDWSKSKSWSYTRRPGIELSGLTLGIIGLGTIGRQVAHIASALGMNIIAHNRTNSHGTDGTIHMVGLETIYERADVISLHCPLNSDSQNMINAHSLSKMKSSSLLINTARGGLINESDLYGALSAKVIKGAALDVLVDEPPTLEHMLYNLDNCIITPHIAWASKASRSRLLDISIKNIRSFIVGDTNNCVNKVSLH